MKPRTDIVNLLSKRAQCIEPCNRCRKEVPMTEDAMARFRWLCSSGACVIFWCDECHEERERVCRRAQEPSPAVLPLP